MKKYLAVFVAPVEAYEKMKEDNKDQSPEEQKAQMDAWMGWMEKHKAHVVDHGGGVGGAKRVTQGGEVSDVRNEIGGYMIVQANDADEAANLFKDSPHYGIDGGAIEVMEIVEM